MAPEERENLPPTDETVNEPPAAETENTDVLPPSEAPPTEPDSAMPSEEAPAEAAAEAEAKLTRKQRAKAKIRQRIRTFALLLTLLLVVGGALTFFFIYNKADKTEKDEGYNYGTTVPEEEVTGLEVGMENVDATSLNEYLTTWATNGMQHLQDKNVLNILLCGVDSEDGNALLGRSDAIMLVTINKKKKAITVTSFYRDSYTYIDLTKNPENGYTLMEKVNAAYSLGGPATLIETLENNYKIAIDDYVAVDFNTFPKLIDSLGGVTVDVTEKEAKYINRTAPSMKGEFPAGDGVTLTGRQALVYSRIRHLDSDMERTNRQRKIISALMKAAQEAGAARVNAALNDLLQYVVTNLSNWEISSLAANALSQGWLNYSLTQLNTPVVETDDATGVSSYIRTKWVWIVDYPRAARDLQMELYGVTNILLSEDENREDYLANLFRNAADRRSYGGSSSGGSAGDDYEEEYDIPTEETEEITQPFSGIFGWLNPPTAPVQEEEDDADAGSEASGEAESDAADVTSPSAEETTAKEARTTTTHIFGFEW
ncbi:MAG: LCP family protein [Oscillospiraceae bacterium]|jgi:LCP family protein required for cell wall assembly|nr:LCP family protein [Oscillospiraceae bacterium]